jgi:hypothetical protein
LPAAKSLRDERVMSQPDESTGEHVDEIDAAVLLERGSLT